MICQDSKVPNTGKAQRHAVQQEFAQELWSGELKYPAPRLSVDAACGKSHHCVLKAENSLV